tara:strand:+ start:89383 stop:90228 length:846 start_codon:yes stop_codon:yes gene_type:complete
MSSILKAFVTGYPVRHSRSPMIHRHWLEKFKIDGTYERLEVSPEEFPGFMQDLASGSTDFVGGNVTIPHKQAAFEHATRSDQLASELGAANTLWVEDGRVMATNTDGYGFAANLDDAAPGWDSEKTAVILGAGGASRAVVQIIQNRGFSRILLVNRTVERAREIADHFGGNIQAHGLDELGVVLDGAGLFVNTTSLGMGGQEVPEIDFSPMTRHAIVTDIVYTPLVTPIMAMADSQGFKTVDGLGMLLHQAVPGFEKWFGVRPDVTADLRQLIVADLENRT